MALKDIWPTWHSSTIAATSLRGAMRGEVYPITVTTSSKRFNVPAAWKGQIVRIHADGGDLFYQIANDATAAVDKTARCTEANSPIDLTLPASGCGKIEMGTWLDVPFPTTAATFALVGTVDCCARAHLSET